MTLASDSPENPKTGSRKVVLFGAGDFASLAWACLTHDSPHEVAGFTVDAAALQSGTHQGLPLVPFEVVEEHFPPSHHDILIAVGPHQVNTLRQARFEAAQAKGYGFASYVASRARTWPDLEIGPGCMVFDGAVIEPFARIGANCVIRAQAQVSHHTRLGDHVFLAPGVTLAGGCRVEDRCFLGVGATLRDATTVAADCIVAAGAVVTRPTEPGGLYVGLPAKRGGEAAAVKIWS